MGDQLSTVLLYTVVGPQVASGGRKARKMLPPRRYKDLALRHTSNIGVALILRRVEGLGKSYLQGCLDAHRGHAWASSGVESLALSGRGQPN